MTVYILVLLFMPLAVGPQHLYATLFNTYTLYLASVTELPRHHITPTPQSQSVIEATTVTPPEQATQGCYTRGGSF